MGSTILRQTMSEQTNMTDFEIEVERRLEENSANASLKDAAATFTRSSIQAKYSYNFSWLGRPIIQYPQDVMALQEIVWSCRPDLIIETGIAHGGSLILSASLLAMLDHCDASAAGTEVDPRAPGRKVVGVDVDIRRHNRDAIDAHPLSPYIQMLQGSSVSSVVLEEVYAIAKEYKRILVCLDSNHTHEHVLAELKAYTPLVTSGSYCIVFDTVVEDLPTDSFTDRPWRPGNSPKTAVWEFLKESPDFEVDVRVDSKLQISVAPMGYLKRISIAR